MSRTLAQRGLIVTELRPDEADLETVFLELTRDVGPFHDPAGLVPNGLGSVLVGS